MKKNHRNLAVGTASLFLFATAVSAEPDQQTYLDSTNRVTLSLRFGLNVSARFKGVGGSLTPSLPAANGRLTPHGDPYNYDDGYAYPDNTGSSDGHSWYWG